MEKLRRLIERPFGELLFSSAVVIGDGATERSFLPPLIRQALGIRAHGVCVVDPGSMKSEYAIAVVKFANLVGIPWLLFSDSDDDGRSAANSLVGAHGRGDSNLIVWIRNEAGDGQEFEATEGMMLKFDAELCKVACAALGFAGDDADILAYMGSKKGSIGRFLADELRSRHVGALDVGRTGDCWPRPIHELLDKLGTLLPPPEARP